LVQRAARASGIGTLSFGPRFHAMTHAILVLFGWLAADLVLATLWTWWRVRLTRRAPAIRLVLMHKAGSTATVERYYGDSIRCT
jgi:hypothetical protein